MSEPGSDPLALWSDRPVEEANLFNPAFVGALLCRMIGDYSRKAGCPMPFALAFLLAPIVLHRRTREALPRSTVSGVLPWLQDNKEQHITFSTRVRRTRSITQEALMFAMAHAFIVADGAALSVGKRRIPASYAKDSDLTDEARECLDRAAFVGRWFAAVGSDQTILAAWGMAP